MNRSETEFPSLSFSLFFNSCRTLISQNLWDLQYLRQMKLVDAYFSPTLSQRSLRLCRCGSESWESAASGLGLRGDGEEGGAWSWVGPGD